MIISWFVSGLNVAQIVFVQMHFKEKKPALFPVAGTFPSPADCCYSAGLWPTRGFASAGPTDYATGLDGWNQIHNLKKSFFDLKKKSPKMQFQVCIYCIYYKKGLDIL